jgi:hypothetical protein
VTLTAEAEIDYFACQRRHVPAAVMTEQIMCEQEIAGPTCHLARLGEFHLLVRDG